MNEVRLILTDGNLGLTPQSDDSTSAIVHYKPEAVDLPEDWGDGTTKIVFSLKEAEALGIVAEDAEFGMLHYHISEFYRVQPAAKLYLVVADAPASTWTFAELVALQQFANAEVKQVFVFAPRKAFAAGDVTLLQTQVDYLTGLGADAGIFRPLYVIYGANFLEVTLSTLPSLRSGTYSAEAVTVVIGQDAGGRGLELFEADNTVTVSCGGAILGAVSRSNVAHSIGWVERNNLASGTELEVLGFGNGELYTDLSYSLLSQLHTRGYTFLRKVEGLTGSYPVDSLNATDATSDYNAMEHVRMAHKAARQVRRVIVPRLSGPIRLLAGGKIDPRDAASIESLIKQVLDSMRASGDISDGSGRVNTSTNIVTTGNIPIALTLRPIGVARNYTVNLALSVS